MIFKKIKNMESMYRDYRRFTLLVILVCGAVSIWAVHRSLRMAGHAQEQIYVLGNGKIFKAFASLRKANLPVEARDHIESFHGFFFTLSPDEVFIDQQLRQALYLIDKSGKEQYDILREKNYYSNLIAGNVSQYLVSDSIHLDLQQVPFYFKFYGTQHILRSSSRVTRRLISEGYLREVPRSPNNSHGLLIERWSILENSDIKVVKQKQ